MNTSIQTVRDNTTSEKVRTISQFLLDNDGQRFVAVFEKRNFERRAIKFVPRNEYNAIVGIKTTDVGRRMVKNKALNDMITVMELYTADDEYGQHEAIRPRTLDLSRIITLKVA